MRSAAAKVHVVTVNDHLAKRDAEDGACASLTRTHLRVILTGLTPDERRAAYAADITL